MKPTLKIFILRFLVAGGIYAVLMAGFDWAQNESVGIGRFFFNMAFFGLCMALFNWWTDHRNYKKNLRKDQITDTH